MARTVKKKRKSILSLLEGGDRRSIGEAGKVAAMVAQEPRRFSELIGGLWSEDELVRMRAADAVEKVTRDRPELLRRYRPELLGLMAECEQQEVRWHLAQMASRIASNTKERLAAAGILLGYLETQSSIVRTFALQGLAELAKDEKALRPKVVDLLHHAARVGSAAMMARARKLLKEIDREG